ncbi:DgyrCDS5029 [Dimorphilus gyrociliatus]|uniref:DgyrCDS5029 n=1 Tax=Dimorphilus gyrociliatus TaxID=2664684 RepID=A0A7I8VLA9_9ANNE|nr:DgyrCDS5029 [Dimorphilus gyrociliatus]
MGLFLYTTFVIFLVIFIKTITTSENNGIDSSNKQINLGVLTASELSSKRLELYLNAAKYALQGYRLNNERVVNYTLTSHLKSFNDQSSSCDLGADFYFQVRDLRDKNITDAAIVILRNSNYIKTAKFVLSAVKIPIYLAYLNNNDQDYKKYFLLNALINEFWWFRKVLFIVESYDYFNGFARTFYERRIKVKVFLITSCKIDTKILARYIQSYKMFVVNVRENVWSDIFKIAQKLDKFRFATTWIFTSYTFRELLANRQFWNSAISKSRSKSTFLAINETFESSKLWKEVKNDKMFNFSQLIYELEQSCNNKTFGKECIEGLSFTSGLISAIKYLIKNDKVIEKSEDNFIKEIKFQTSTPSLVMFVKNQWEVVGNFSPTSYINKGLNLMVDPNLKNVFLSIFRGSLISQNFTIFAQKGYPFLNKNNDGIYADIINELQKQLSFHYEFVTNETKSDIRIERFSRIKQKHGNIVHLFYENLETGILTNLSSSPNIVNQIMHLIKWNELKYLVLIFGVMFCSSAFLLSSLPRQTPFSSSKESRGPIYDIEIFTLVEFVLLPFLHLTPSRASHFLTNNILNLVWLAIALSWYVYLRSKITAHLISTSSLPKVVQLEHLQDIRHNLDFRYERGLEPILDSLEKDLWWFNFTEKVNGNKLLDNYWSLEGIQKGGKGQLALITSEYSLMSRISKPPCHLINPNEDTEWNDILRKHNILPPKEEKKEEEIEIVEPTAEEKLSSLNIDKLNELEDEIDDEDEKIFEEYKRKRIQEMMEAQKAAKFGSVLEISKAQYVTEVNEAGEEIWVVVFIYNNRVKTCKYIDEYLRIIAQLHPYVKFVKGVSEVMIQNYPDKNLPTLFIYKNGDMKARFIGNASFGDSLKTCAAFEQLLVKKEVLNETLVQPEEKNNYKDDSDSD